MQAVSAEGEADVAGSSGYSRRPLLLAAAIALLMLAVGCIDFAITSGQVPDAPAACDSLACSEDRDAEFDDRFERVRELEDDFGARAWLYAAVALVSVLGAAALAFTRTAPESRRELFTDLGVGGVAWLILSVIVSLVGSDANVAAPPKPIFYPGIAVLLVAGAGTVLTRRPAREPRTDTVPIRVAGFAITVLALALAAISLSGNGDPCEAEVPGWVESLNAVGLVLAGIAAIVGLVAVARRLWFVGLVTLTVGPFAVLLALFTTVCWN